MVTPNKKLAIYSYVVFTAALAANTLVSTQPTFAQNGVQLNNPVLGAPVQNAPPIQNTLPLNTPTYNNGPQNTLSQGTGSPMQNRATPFNQSISPNQIPANRAQRNIANPNGTPPNVTTPSILNPNSNPRFVAPNVTAPNVNEAANPQVGSPHPPTIRPNYDEPAATARSASGAEIIRERYPNGATKIEREVVQDANKNFINHGEWKLLLPNGRVTAKAQFQFGKKSGEWARWLTAAEAPALNAAPFNQFKAPFLSTFQYNDDKLNGVWQVVDSANRKLFEINLQDGKRESTARFFFANGRNYKLMTYQNGRLDGPLQVWNAQGALIENRKFQKGHEVGKITEYYPTAIGRKKLKKLEFDVLAGEIEVEKPDDPWNVRFAIEKKVGVDLKNGTVEAWYPNGQLKFTGKYEGDMQDGVFAWYFQNGQKQAEGKLIDGERVGEWTWWHQNGMRASSGQYVAGKPDGDWQWWLANGKLNNTKSFEADLGANEDMPTLQNASYENLPPMGSGGQ